MTDNTFTVRVKKLEVAWEIVQASQRGRPTAELDFLLSAVRKAYQHVHQTVEHPNKNANESAD